MIACGFSFPLLQVGWSYCQYWQNYYDALARQNKIGNLERLEKRIAAMEEKMKQLNKT